MLTTLNLRIKIRARKEDNNETKSKLMEQNSHDKNRGLLLKIRWGSAKTSINLFFNRRYYKSTIMFNEI